MRSRASGAFTTNPFASSETPFVTTETTIDAPAGERSKHSFAHVVSSTHASRTPASKVARKSGVTRADSVKSPAGGVPSRVCALSSVSAATPLTPLGSTKRSVPAGAIPSIPDAVGIHAEPSESWRSKGREAQRTASAFLHGTGHRAGSGVLTNRS